MDHHHPAHPIPRWTEGPAGFLPKANQQLDVIDQHTRHGNKPGGINRRPGRPQVILAKITDAGDAGGQYKATEVKGVDTSDLSDGPPTGVDFSTSTNARVWDGASGHLPQVVELTGNAGIATGTVVRLIPTYDQNGDALWVFSCPQAGFFPVQLTEDGGDAGDATTQCSWTYSAYALSDSSQSNALGTGLTPKKTRPDVGEMVHSDVGVGYYDDSGGFQLYDAGESTNTEECPSS